MATGQQWEEHFKSVPILLLQIYLDAIKNLEYDSMFATEYSGMGIFDGIHNLKTIIQLEIARRKQSNVDV